MKIFVTGFQRSGTTLLKDLIQKHPDVKKMWHETGLLKLPRKRLYTSKFLVDKTTISERRNNPGLGRSIKIPIDFDLRTTNWGEKIPYRNFVIKKGMHIPITDYCHKWNMYFLPEACIINVIRHPVDMGLSTKKIGYTRGVFKPVKEFKKVGPLVITELNKFENALHIKYEDLVIRPTQTLEKIFKFCKLDFSDKTIRKVIKSDVHGFGFINKKRAFNFKSKKVKVNIERLGLQEIINFLNKIEGVKYDLRK